MNGHAGQMSYAGLINFGKIDDISYNFFEIPVYILMGVGGGIIGALFNYINYNLTVFRMRFIKARTAKVMEALFICLLTALIGYVMILCSAECHPINRIKPNNFIKYPVRLHCPSGQFSTMGSLFINTPETVLINMLHVEATMYSVPLLLLFVCMYFALAVVTYGLSISSGLFIPSLLIGATYGRLIAILLFDLLKGHAYTQDVELDSFVTKFALIGAASVLGGTVRMTLSLTVILIETTGNLTVGLPLMICLIFAKWIGDSFNEGKFDCHSFLVVFDQDNLNLTF
jgi:chloride channel 7